MKKAMERASRLTTFQKTYLSYLLICAVPIAIFFTALAINTRHAVEKEVQLQQTHEADILSSAVDAELQRLQRLGLQLADTQWVKKRGSENVVFDDEFSFANKRVICQDLRSYITVSGFIRNLAVVFPKRGEVYSSLGYYQAEDFFHSYSLGKGQLPLEQQLVYDAVQLPENLGLVQGWQLGMTGDAAQRLFYVASLEYLQPLRSFLLVEINTSTLRNLLGKMRTENMISFCIMQNDATLSSSVFSPLPAAAVYEEKSTIFTLSFKTAFAIRGHITASQLLYLGVLLLIALLLIVNLAYVLTRIGYRPLERLVLRVSGRHQLPAASENEYQLIEQSLSTLYEERENVMKRAEQYRATAKANFLRQLLQGYFNKGGAAEKLEEFDIGFSDRLYHIVFLVSEKGEAAQQTGFGLMPLEEALSSADYLYEMVEVSRARFAAIVAITREQKRQFDADALAARIGLSYAEHTETQPVISVGTVEPGILGIGKSYYFASETLFAQSYPGEKKVTLYKEFYYPTEWELQLINCVKIGQQELSHTILHEIRAENEKQGISTHQMHQLVVMIAETLSKIINEFDMQPASYSEQYEAINRRTDAEGLWNTLYAIVDKLCTEKVTGVDSENTERQIVNHVKEHLTDPNLSLKDLGDRFNLSVSAVSKIFKRVCGINFYDFLLSGRMELACEMLETKKVSLADVALAVGYENEYSFKRAFTRFYGVSVTEYLRKHKK